MSTLKKHMSNVANTLKYEKKEVLLQQCQALHKS